MRAAQRVLVDTSVWVRHFRHRDDVLVALLGRNAVLCHPLVVAELACGTPPAPRQSTLQSLRSLPQARRATLSEALAFVERERLYGLGCGVVDIILLASTRLCERTALWTLDARLAALGARFDVGWGGVR